LRAFHKSSPDVLGLELQRLRRLAAPQLPVAAWGALADELVKERKLARSGPLVHLPDHKLLLSGAEQVLAQKALPLLEEGGFDPPFVREAAQTLRAPEPQLRTLLMRLAKQGVVFQVVPDLFYPLATVKRLARIAEELEKQHGGVFAAHFRDSTELGRKRAIQILEFFDRVGFTRRVNDEHRLRRPHAFLDGAPEAVRPG
jgi:selenocysteine-specific elongation factor